MARSNVVAIAIAALNRGAKPMADALHPASWCADVKGATGPHQHPSHIDALLAPCRDGGPDQIPGLKALDLLCPFGFGAGKAKLVDVAFLSVPMPGCCNQEGNDASHFEAGRGARAHTGRVNPVRFRQGSLCAVELGQPTRPTFDRQPHRFQSLIQGPSSAIDRSGILEWGLCLSQKTCQHIRFVGQKDANILAPLGLVTGIASQAQVADSICPPIGFRLDMLNLKRYSLGPTVTTGSIPLFQEVCSNFRAKERAVLVLHPADLWILHLVLVEFDEFQADGPDGAQAQQPPDPGQDVGHPAFQRGRKPPGFPSSIVEPGFSVAGFPLSSAPTNGPSLVQCLFDNLPSMGQFCGENNLSCRLIEQGDARSLAARIDLEPEGGQHRFVDGCLENDRERVAFEHRRFARREQDACSAWMDRIKWPLVCV